MNSQKSFTANRLVILLIGFFLTTAPLWAKNFATVGGHHTFLTADSLLVLGFSLIGSLLLIYLLPESSLTGANRFSSFMKNNYRLILPIMFCCFFAGLYFVNNTILKRFMNSGDEHSCYFLAECIRSGRFWVETPAFHEFFEVTHIGNKGGKWFSVYPPGWPFVLAIALQFNIQDLINPFLAVIATAVFFVFGKKIFGFVPSILGVLFMVLTPFYLLNHASYYSHTVCLLMIAVFLPAFWRWNEKGEVFSAIIAALVISYGLATRYLTMAAVAGPFLLLRLFYIWKNKRKFGKADVIFSVLLVAGFILNLYYNYLITGNFFDAPNHYFHRWERLGFQNDYTPLNALIYMVARLFYFIDWASPILPILYFLSLKRLIQSRKLLELESFFRLGFIFLAFGYLFYYSWGGNQYGPRYYFEGLPFLAISAGDEIYKRWITGGLSERKFLIGLVVAVVIGNLFFLSKQSRFYQKVSSERKALYELVESSAKKPALVFIKGFLGDILVMGEEDAVRNDPFLESEILYAHDLGDKNQALMNAYPGRSFYRGTYDRNAKLPKLEAL